MIKTKILLLALIIAFNLMPGCKERLFNNPLDPDKDERGYSIESTINLKSGIIPVDMTFAGDSLWISDGSSSLYSINYNSGNIIRILNNGSGNIYGICYDNSNLWTNTNYFSELNNISIISGEIINSIKIPEGNYSSMDFFNSTIYISDKKTNSIKIINPQSGENIGVINAPSFSIDGFCFNGNFLWILEASTLKLYKTDINGNIINSFKTPSDSPTALACGKDFIWIADRNGKIYKLNFQ